MTFTWSDSRDLVVLPGFAKYFSTFFLVVFVFYFIVLFLDCAKLGIIFYLLGVISSSRLRSRVRHVNSSWLKLFFFFQFCHSSLGCLGIEIHNFFFLLTSILFCASHHDLFLFFDSIHLLSLFFIHSYPVRSMIEITIFFNLFLH